MLVLSSLLRLNLTSSVELSLDRRGTVYSYCLVSLETSLYIIRLSFLCNGPRRWHDYRFGTTRLTLRLLSVLPFYLLLFGLCLSKLNQPCVKYPMLGSMLISTLRTVNGLEHSFVFGLFIAYLLGHERFLLKL